MVAAFAGIFQILVKMWGAQSERRGQVLGVGVGDGVEPVRGIVEPAMGRRSELARGTASSP